MLKARNICMTIFLTAGWIFTIYTLLRDWGEWNALQWCAPFVIGLGTAALVLSGIGSWPGKRRK